MAGIIITIVCMLISYVLVSASPIRIYVLSSDKGVGAVPVGHDALSQAEPAPFIRWGMAAADVKPMVPVTFEQRPGIHHKQAEINRHGGRLNMHRCSGGFRRKMFRLTNWLRKTVGLPPIEHPHRGPHGHHGPHRGHHAPPPHHLHMEVPSGDVFHAIAGPHHRVQHSTFGGRLQRALLSLGPWEGRFVAFVLGKQYQR